jgi:uncharacterized protein (TIGR02001 family)
MKPVKLSVAVALVLAAMPLVSFAQDAAEEEASSPWNLTLAATSDYVWRGLSQSEEDPAFQAGLTYTTPVGVYVGTWGSNVKFGDAGGWENDWYVGYNKDISDNFNLDVMYNYYSYPGDAINGDFGELIAKGTFFGHYNATVAYSNNFANTKGSSVYYQLGTSWDLPAGFGVSAGVGRSTFDSDVGIDDYTDYSVSLSKALGPGSLSVGWYDTDIDDVPEADSRVVVTFSVSVP